MSVVVPDNRDGVVNALPQPYETLTDADDAITISAGTVYLNDTDAITATLADPTIAGLVLRIVSVSAGTHVITSASTFDGTNNTATFDAAREALTLISTPAGSWYLLLNTGSVALSDV